LTRQLVGRTNHEEVLGLLALMLLHHARRPARTDSNGRLVPLAEQNRRLWDTHLIAEGVGVLQRALARDRLGEFQAQAAVAALHAGGPAAAGPSRPARPTARAPVCRLWRHGPLAAPATPLSRRTCTSATVTWSPHHGSTPRLPGQRPTFPNVTTSPGKPHGSTRACVAECSLTRDRAAPGLRMASCFTCSWDFVPQGSGGRVPVRSLTHKHRAGECHGHPEPDRSAKGTQGSRLPRRPGRSDIA